MFIANDPYNGAARTPRHHVRAVFIGKRIVAYVRTSRITPTSAACSGSEAAVCQSINQKAYAFRGSDHAGGQDQSRRFRHDPAQPRTPDERVGDLQAQFAANIVGAHVTALSSATGA